MNNIQKFGRYAASVAITAGITAKTLPAKAVAIEAKLPVTELVSFPKIMASQRVEPPKNPKSIEGVLFYVAHFSGVAFWTFIGIKEAGKRIFKKK
ncbi:MAG: hypothetical protein WCK67_09070 [bacterium]